MPKWEIKLYEKRSDAVGFTAKDYCCSGDISAPKKPENASEGEWALFLDQMYKHVLKSKAYAISETLQNRDKCYNPSKYRSAISVDNKYLDFREELASCDDLLDRWRAFQGVPTLASLDPKSWAGLTFLAVGLTGGAIGGGLISGHQMLINWGLSASFSTADIAGCAVAGVVVLCMLVTAAILIGQAATAHKQIKAFEKQEHADPFRLFTVTDHKDDTLSTSDHALQGAEQGT